MMKSTPRHLGSGSSYVFALILISTLFFFTVNSLVANFVIHSSGSIVYSLKPLHVEGRYVKDASGNIIYLRGVVKGVCNSDRPGGNWPKLGGGEDSGYNQWDSGRVRWHLQNMKNFGFTAWRCFGWDLRAWKFRETDPNCALAVQHTIEAISIANEVGLYVIVAPYAVADRDIEGDDRETLPFPPYIDTTRGKQTITSEQDFINIWVDIATTLKDYPNVLFELYNEPGYAKWMSGFPDNKPQQEADWFRVVQATINAIRKVAAIPIIVQWQAGLMYNDYKSPENQNGGLQWVAEHPLTGGNIVISAHLYRTYGAYGHVGSTPQNPTGTGEIPHTYEQVKTRLEFLLQDVWKEKPVFIGEMGCDVSKSGTELEEELEAFSNVLQLFNEWGISYTVFTWKSTGQFRIFETAPWLPPLNRAGQILVEKVQS